MTWDREVRIRGSWAISRVWYSFERREMLVYFVSTKTTWLYENVEPRDFATVVSAHSVGRAFNIHIRPRYNGRRVALGATI